MTNKNTEPTPEEAPKEELYKTYKKIEEMNRSRQDTIHNQVAVPVKAGEPLFVITGQELTDSKPTVAAILGVNPGSELSVSFFEDEDQPAAIFEVTHDKTAEHFSITVNPHLPGEGDDPFVTSATDSMEEGDKGPLTYSKDPTGIDVSDFGALVSRQFFHNEFIDSDQHEPAGKLGKDQIPDKPITSEQLQALNDLLY